MEWYGIILSSLRYNETNFEEIENRKKKSSDENTTLFSEGFKTCCIIKT